MSAVLFGALVAAVAWLSEARLGANLVGDRGISRVAPEAWLAGALAFVWALVTGIVGWYTVGSPSRRSRTWDL